MGRRVSGYEREKAAGRQDDGHGETGGLEEDVFAKQERLFAAVTEETRPVE
jgi:hypothetical protein